MIDTILHSVPYAVGVCVCGGIAAYAGLKGLGHLGGYSIGLSIKPVDVNKENAIDREKGVSRRRSKAERRAAKALAEAESRARTRKYLREAKELDSEARRQFEAALAKQIEASEVLSAQKEYDEADKYQLDAVRIAQKRRERQAARVAELDAVRAARKAEKAEQAAAEQAAGRKVRRAADIPLDVAEELVRDEQEETAQGAESAAILDAAARPAAAPEPDNLLDYYAVPG